MHRVRVRVPGLSGTWTLGGYDSGVGRAVRAAKVRADRHVVALLGDIFARRLAVMVAEAGFEAVVPAPSTRASLWRRGFSAASILAASVSRVSGIPRREVLRRASGRRQAGLGRRARRANLKGKVRAVQDVEGRVLLIDDVVTTGATADACVRELLGGGAQSVWLATVCVTRRRADRPARC
jgi:ComF family protein